MFRVVSAGPSAWRESLRDLGVRSPADPGVDAVVNACADWLLAAQRLSRTADGGVASHFSLKDGWASSYPETTGYIIPSMLAVAGTYSRPECREAAERMVAWLEGIQFEDGSFQGGNVDASPRAPVVFNTGQILFGLAAGVSAFGETHRAPMRRAADWLLAAQDADGAWRKARSPFTTPGPKAYETHVAWALLEADAVDPGRGYGEAALANIRWALTQQTEAGWFENCGLSSNDAPITHTIAYTVRGVLAGWLRSKDPLLLEAARRTADAVAPRVADDGRLAGAFHRDWSEAATWVCMTGSSQLAECFIILHEATGEARYRDVARRLNRFVRARIRIDGPAGERGGVKGSFPTFGDYGPFRYLNWAAKFTIDSNLAERRLA